MKEQLPIPSELITIIKKNEARQVIERMQIENILLKHLVNILDPEHDYQFDQKNMTLIKTKVGGDLNDENFHEVQPGTGKEKPFRGVVDFNGEAKGLRGSSNKSNVGEVVLTKTPTEKLQPSGDKDSA